eukprot:5185624-Pyramimonas_sp.AAC.3
MAVVTTLVSLEKDTTRWLPPLTGSRMLPAESAREIRSGSHSAFTTSSSTESLRARLRAASVALSTRSIGAG